MRAALLSVTDKTDLIPFAEGLKELGYTLLSTSGTAAALKGAGLPVTDVAEITGFEEIFDGRVKTLHPKIHGGILFRRSHENDGKTAKRLGIPAIDLVVVNLYDFSGEALARGLPPEAAMEYVDIGGPAMLRAAAKNHRDVLPVCDPADYQRVLTALREGHPSPLLRRELAAKVFAHTAHYDAMIASYIKPHDEVLAEVKTCVMVKMRDLTYGENPHQRAALYRLAHEPGSGWQNAKVLQGEKLSYNNLLDAEAAIRLVSECDTPTLAIIKHNNPCGVATSEREDMAALFEKARATDPVSAFGGIVAANRPVTAALARAMSEMFLECVIAPAFDAEALKLLAAKKKLRLVSFSDKPRRDCDVRSLSGAWLLQTPDTALASPETWRVKPHGAPLPTHDVSFAMAVAKHVRSNAIVLVRNGQTLGIGAGQMSRVDSMRLALEKAKTHGHDLEDAVLASDGFFPFRDAIDLLADTGVTTVIQPGGSIRDEEVIQACLEHGITLVMTGERHFDH